MRGRRPKPTAVRQLAGNPGKRRINHEEPAPPPLSGAALDVPPREVAASPVAAAEWARLAPMLRLARQITAADRGALVALCLEYARYLDATHKVSELGMVVKAPSGYPMSNPYLSIASRALAACTRLWPELGLTPSSRARLTTTPDAGGDAFAEFDEAPPLLDVDPSFDKDDTRH